MPNIKSVIKDVKKSRERHARNIAVKSRIKTLVKKARTAVEAGDEQVQQSITAATSAIDKAAQKGIIHKNAAARRKSRLMKATSKAQAE